MASYFFPDHISGDTFLGTRFVLSNHNGPINLSGASILLETDKGEKLSTGTGEIAIINKAGGIFDIKEQIIPWRIGMRKYTLKITFSNGRVRTYLDGTWKIVSKFGDLMEIVNITVIEMREDVGVLVTEMSDKVGVFVEESPPEVTDLTINEITSPGLDEDTLLKEWAAGKDVQMIKRTLDADGRTISAILSWPDGSEGVYTATAWNATHECYDGWKKSHTDSGKTVTQAAYTRNAEGMITNKPALTI